MLLAARYTREMPRGKGAGVRTRSPKSWAPYVTNRTAPVQPQPERKMRITSSSAGPLNSWAQLWRLSAVLKSGTGGVWWGDRHGAEPQEIKQPMKFRKRTLATVIGTDRLVA